MSETTIFQVLCIMNEAERYACAYLAGLDAQLSVAYAEDYLGQARDPICPGGLTNLEYDAWSAGLGA
jgi:hypothetical protein